ncbi:transporter substrate-binding domain-containing protein [Aestuariibacter halophilus]|uniref:Transporter substrate-binding domain-containing protein n=1 Tax=Fluctibacter halophilus TaxID=226011 RepID=A0ABS8GAV0_9ALTE|nr:transporter substrate-binding domain-containing protein [Aestuariibacter halophilus]MCC2616351.1 transporter substrate-binding domain-containing protein [Aestuariibacter halophilus]
MLRLLGFANRWLFGVLVCNWVCTVWASDSNKIVIGSQNFDYYPHYDFTQSSPRGYAVAVFEAFAKAHGYRIEYVALPTKRLQRELYKGTVNLAYPDNPRWHQKEQLPDERYYSDTVAVALTGTMVPPDRQGMPLESFNVLAIPFGFTPVKWYDAINQHRIRVATFPDALAALQAVILGRADGADVEWNVSRYLLEQSEQSEQLVLDKNLPYLEVSFHVSTYQHRELVEQFNRYLQSAEQQLHALRQRYQLRGPASEQLPPAPSSNTHTSHP